MKNPIALRILFFVFIIYLHFFFVGKIYANSEQFSSDGTWGVYNADPFSNPQAIFFGNAEEVSWPGPNSYPGILPEAKWIWAPGIVGSASPVDLTEYYFSKSFTIDNPNATKSGNIIIVVDDLADILVNGSLSESHGSITNVNLSGNTPKTIDITSFLKTGKNTITIRAQNGPSSFSAFSCSHCTWNQNPAGLIFSGLLDWNLYEKELNVPLLKQTFNPWQPQVYDNANKWAPTNPTIRSWGCALTSGAMILNYHGINKLPNGIILNPGSLNTWLKNQKDGYLGTGWVNWLALSRLSKLAKLINNITTFDALQYTRTGSGDKNKLTTDINNLLPDILEVPGHFIVAKGIKGATFSINDPYYDNRTTLNDYSNTFSALGTYTPSYTDLSYIMLNTNPSIIITVKDSNHNTVGESFIQQPLVNDNNTSQANLPIKIFYLPKPNEGNYTLQLSSSNKQNYSLDIYFYNVNGEVKNTNIKGFLNKNKQDNFILNFDKNNLKKDNIKHKSKEKEFEDEVDKTKRWFEDLF